VPFVSCPKQFLEVSSRTGSRAAPDLRRAGKLGGSTHTGSYLRARIFLPDESRRGWADLRLPSVASTPPNQIIQFNTFHCMADLCNLLESRLSNPVCQPMIPQGAFLVQDPQDSPPTHVFQRTVRKTLADLEPPELQRAASPQASSKDGREQPWVSEVFIGARRV